MFSLKKLPCKKWQVHSETYQRKSYKWSITSSGLWMQVLSSWFNPLPDDKFFTLPNWKSLQTIISKLDENGSKLPKWVENIVGKGEIAHYKQFLLFPVFSKRLVSQGQKVSFCGNGLRGSGVSEQWFLKAVDCLIKVVSDTSFTVYLYGQITP